MSKAAAVTTAEKKAKLHPKLAGFLKLAGDRMDIESCVIKPSKVMRSINSGSTVINIQIGGTRLPTGQFICPGWPRGRVSEIFGRESSGKTTLALMGMAQALAEGGSGLYVDIEHSMVDTYADTLGVDFLGSNAMRIAPPSAEEVETAINSAALSGIDFIVLDSVAALRTRAQLQRNSANEKEKEKLAEVPRFMSSWLPELQAIAAKTGTHVMFLNQTRDKIGAFGYAEETLKSTPGGNALKFFASIRMLLTPKQTTKAKRWNPLTKENEEVQIATDVLIKNIKNKIDKRTGHAAMVTIRYGVGIDEFRTVMNMALAYGVITTTKKAGGDDDSKNGKSSKSDDKKKKKKVENYIFTSETGVAVQETGYERIRQRLLNNPEIFAEVQRRSLDLMLLAQKQLNDEELSKIEQDAITTHVADDDDYEEYAMNEPEEVEPEEMDITADEMSPDDMQV